MGRRIRPAFGRSQSIYAASLLRNDSCEVFVHDMNRPTEKWVCEHWLGQLPRVTNRLAHYGGRWEGYRHVSFFFNITFPKMAGRASSKGPKAVARAWRHKG